MADVIAPSPEQCRLGRGKPDFSHRYKLQDVVAPAMDRELEDVMASARESLLRGATSRRIEEAVARCRDRFDGIAEAFPEAAVSADYYVTRARFEEFVGNRERVADLYAAAAKNGAKPREVVQNNFIQFLARQSAGPLTPTRKTAPSATYSKYADEPRHTPRALPCTPVSEGSKSSPMLPKRVETPSSLRGGARRVRTHQVECSPASTIQPSSRGPGPCTPTAILRTPKIGAAQRVRTPAQHVSPTLDIGSVELGTALNEQNDVTAAPKIGAPQRVRTPAKYMTPVSVVGNDDLGTEVDDQNIGGAGLPATLQNYAAELRHQKDSKSDTAENINRSLTSAVVFSPVRVPKSQVETTGARAALTPVRRSPRLNRGQDVNKLDEMLEQTEYCYRPNASVDALR